MPQGTLTDWVWDSHGNNVPSGLFWPAYVPFVPWALAAWSQASGGGFLSLGEVVDTGARYNTFEAGPGNTLFGDIRVGVVIFDGVGGILAHAYEPGTTGTFPEDFAPGIHSILGDIHIDSQEPWCDILGQTCPLNSFDIATVLVHEFGHALGLGHSDDPDSVMWPFLSFDLARRTLSQDDILGIQAIYGNNVPEPSTLVLASLALLLYFAGGTRRTERLGRPTRARRSGSDRTSAA